MASQRTRVLKEVVTTEEAYVENLRLVQELYMVPLKPSPTAIKESSSRASISLNIYHHHHKHSNDKKEPIVPSTLLDIKEYNKLFSDITVIIKVNQELLRQLKEFFELDRSGKKPPKTLGQIFMDLGPFLRVYTQYCNNYDDISMLIKDIKKKNAKFAQFLEEVRADPRSKGQSLNSLLIMPVQRIPRYCLLLRELLSETSKYHGDYKNLQDALEKLKEVADYVNTKMKESEKKKIVYNIYTTLTNCDIELIQPKRYLAFFGEIQKITMTRLVPRTFYVFNDIIVYCKMSSSLSSKSGGDSDHSGHHKTTFWQPEKGIDKKQKMEYCGCIELEQTPFAWVRDLQDTEATKNAFQLVHAAKTVTLVADSPAMKKTWMDNLNKVLADILSRHPEYALQLADIKIKETKNKIAKLFTIAPQVYDASIAPKLPSRRKLPPLTPAAIEEIKHKRVAEAVCLCEALFKFDEQEQKKEQKRKSGAMMHHDLGFEPGDILLVYSQQNADWWVARHFGVKFHEEQITAADLSRWKGSSAAYAYASSSSANNKRLSAGSSDLLPSKRKSMDSSSSWATVSSSRGVTLDVILSTTAHTSDDSNSNSSQQAPNNNNNRASMLVAQNMQLVTARGLKLTPTPKEVGYIPHNYVRQLSPEERLTIFEKMAALQEQFELEEAKLTQPTIKYNFQIPLKKTSSPQQQQQQQQQERLPTLDRYMLRINSGGDAWNDSGSAGSRLSIGSSLSSGSSDRLSISSSSSLLTASGSPINGHHGGGVPRSPNSWRGGVAAAAAADESGSSDGNATTPSFMQEFRAKKEAKKQLELEQKRESVGSIGSIGGPSSMSLIPSSPSAASSSSSSSLSSDQQASPSSSTTTTTTITITGAGDDVEEEGALDADGKKKDCIVM